MLTNILESVRDLTGVLRKETCYESVDYLYRSIESNLLPLLDDMINNKSDKFIKQNDLLSLINRLAKIKATDNAGVLVHMRMTFKKIVDAKSQLHKLVEKNLADVDTYKTMSVRSGAIIKVVQDLLSMTSYSLDLLYYILLKSDNNKGTDLPKIKLKTINDMMPTFCTMYSIYSKNFSKTLTEIANMSESKIEELTKAQEGSGSGEYIVNTIISKQGSMPELPVSTGFINNPIYHFRMWLIDREIKKYESLKIKKQMVEMKLLELRLRQRDENDPNLNKQVSYYEEKLSKVEYDIAKIEE